MVFDYDASYLYDGTNTFLLQRSSVVDDRRAVLPSVLDNASDSSIKLYNMKDSECLGYTSPLNSRAASIYKCDVKVVSQNPPSNLCWAACIACIVNCKNGESLTAINVAKKH